MKFTNKMSTRLCRKLNVEKNTQAMQRPAQRKRFGPWSMGTEEEQQNELREEKNTRHKMSSLLAAVYCFDFKSRQHLSF